MLNPTCHLRRTVTAFHVWWLLALVAGLLFAFSAGAAYSPRVETKAKEPGIGYGTQVVNIAHNLADSVP